MPKDIPEPAQEGAVEVMYETLVDLVQRFHDHTQVIPVHHVQVGDGGVSGVSLSMVSSSDDKNSKTAGNGGMWSDDDPQIDQTLSRM
nr:hypothetical protein [Tanacetum cinerariifolium]